MNSIRSLAILLSLCLAGNLSAQQVVTFNNFTPSGEFDYAGTTFGSWGRVGFILKLGQRIVPTTSGILSTIEAAMSVDEDAVVEISLHSEVEGVPGDDFLWEQSYSNIYDPNDDLILTFPTDGDFLLRSGKPYWIVVTSYTPILNPGGWLASLNPIQPYSIFGGPYSGNGWVHPDDFPHANSGYATRVFVTPVPEPTGMLLIGFASVAIFTQRR